MLVTQELSNFVKDYKSPSPFGCHCVFIKFDENWGIKTYNYAQERDAAVERQTRMAHYGYAPKVGQAFNVGEDKFCYMTQLAIPVVDCTEKNNGRFQQACVEADLEYPNVYRDINKLVQQMCDAGYPNIRSDAHYGNFGFIEGKLVCIDFS